MSQFSKKEWVCLVTPEKLAAQRALQAARNKGSWMECQPLKRPLWRQIELTATPVLITFALGSVEEETALNGYWTGSQACRTIKLTWDDLNDFDGLTRLFQHEQVCVLYKVSDMIDSLRAHMVPLRRALAA